MKKYCSILLFLCVSVFNIQAQSTQNTENYSEEFDKVTNYEMTMTEYPKDKDAEALVIYELGDYFFQRDDDKGFVLQMDYKIKIKILKEAGLKEADFEIPFYVGGRDLEGVFNIDGTTYNNESGKLIKTPLDKSKIFEEKHSDKWISKKFTMPNVRVGSVIELKYSISTTYFVNVRPWEFQKKIPVVHSLLTYRAIPYYEYTYILKGTNKFSETSSTVLRDELYFGNLKYKEMEYKFGMKDLSAFRDEEFITSSKDYMVSLNLQLSKIYYPRGGSKEYISTWPLLTKEFMEEEYFGKYLNNSLKEAKKILPALGLEGKSQNEQLDKITSYVKDNYNWNEYVSKVSSQKVSDFIKTKKGNNADINLFLVGLLKAAGIDADPVMLSTRSHGIVRKNYPFSQFLNYVIVRANIDGTQHLIDATEPLLANNELPTRCINTDGLIVKDYKKKDAEVEWIFVGQNIMSTTKKTFKINLLPEKNSIDVTSTYKSAGYDAYKYKGIYMGKAENLTDYLKTKLQINPLGDVTVEDEKDKTFNFSFNFTMSAEQTDEKIFINPFCYLAVKENPFKQTTRTLPIDLVYVNGESYLSEIEIPEGYKVEYLPKNTDHDGRQMTIKYKAAETDGKIIIEASYFFTQNMYEANAYIPLKVTMNEVIKKMGEMVVLVKKTN